MAWGTNIGGIATLLGGARGPLALGILTESTGATISFIRWSLATLPLVALLLVVGYFVLVACFADEPVDIERSIAAISQRRAQLGRISFEETAVAVVLAVTVVAWSLFSDKLGLAGIAILAVVALFVFDLLSWQEVEGHVNWGIILMYGGAIALGSALERSKAAAFMAQSMARQTSSPTLLLAILSLAGRIARRKPEPFGGGGLDGAGWPWPGRAITAMDVRALTLAITLPAGLTYIMPVSTPANAWRIPAGICAPGS